MTLLYMTTEQVLKTAAEIQKAIDRGFPACNAVLRAEKIDGQGNLSLSFSDLWLKAHPTDPSLDWGRGPPVELYRFENGKLINDYDGPAGPN